MNFSLENDCHDHSVDSHGFTEDDANLLYEYLTKFLDLILGALTAAPKMLAPAIKIPLI